MTLAELTGHRPGHFSTVGGIRTLRRRSGTRDGPGHMQEGSGPDDVRLQATPPPSALVSGVLGRRWSHLDRRPDGRAEPAVGCRVGPVACRPRRARPGSSVDRPRRRPYRRRRAGRPARPGLGRHPRRGVVRPGAPAGLGARTGAPHRPRLVVAPLGPRPRRAAASAGPGPQPRRRRRGGRLGGACPTTASGSTSSCPDAAPSSAGPRSRVRTPRPSRWPPTSTSCSSCTR